MWCIFLENNYHVRKSYFYIQNPFPTHRLFHDFEKQHNLKEIFIQHETNLRAKSRLTLKKSSISPLLYLPHVCVSFFLVQKKALTYTWMKELAQKRQKIVNFLFLWYFDFFSLNTEVITYNNELSELLLLNIKAFMQSYSKNAKKKQKEILIHCKSCLNSILMGCNANKKCSL